MATGREVVDAISACTTGVEAASASPEGSEPPATTPKSATMIPSGDTKKRRIRKDRRPHFVSARRARTCIGVGPVESPGGRGGGGESSSLLGGTPPIIGSERGGGGGGGLRRREPRFGGSSGGGPISQSLFPSKSPSGSGDDDLVGSPSPRVTPPVSSDPRSGGDG